MANRCITLLIAILALSGCSLSRPADMPIVQPAVGANSDASLITSAIQGKLLAVKDGALVQWTNAGLKTLASGQRYQSPAFSPDGSRIAATIVGDNHSDLVLLDSNGRRLLQLTDNWSKARIQDSAWALHPTWSTDDKHIAYVSDIVGAQMSLWSIDDAGANRHQILTSPGWGGVDEPSWSPNRTTIAVTVFEDNKSQLYLVNAATGTTTKLTDLDGGAYDPAFSPDGTRVAFVGRANRRNDIMVIDLPDGTPTKLTDIGTARAPVWSPDGSLITFVAERGSGFDLYAMRPKFPSPVLVPTNNIKRLTDGQKLDATSGLSWAR